ncbi:hypothetical protein KSS87_000007 [Heliosperma pusillum]|nr:hypothetical protein KSS87_000007 [Heliosperma pusillum]
MKRSGEGERRWWRVGWTEKRRPGKGRQRGSGGIWSDVAATAGGGGVRSGLIATGVSKDQLFIGDISTQYRSGNTTVDLKVNTYSNVFTKITFDEALPGIKTSLSVNIPDQKSGKSQEKKEPQRTGTSMLRNKKQKYISYVFEMRKFHAENRNLRLKFYAAKKTLMKVDVLYSNYHAAVNSSVGLTPSPLLNFNAAIGKEDISLGGEAAFDTASASFIKYNAGITFNKPDFSAALILMDKGQAIKASYFHSVNPSTAVAAEMTHRLSSYENSFMIGSSHVVDPITSLKTRFANNGKVGLLCQREWRPKSLVTFSAEYDTKATASASKFGVTLALKP